MKEWMNTTISPLADAAIGPVPASPPGYLVIVREPTAAADAESQKDGEEETTASQDVVQLRGGGQGRPRDNRGFGAFFGMDTGDVGDVVHLPIDLTKISVTYKLFVGDVEVFLLLAHF